MKKFDNLNDRLNYLVENDYYSKEILDLYDQYVIDVIYDFIRAKNFKFQSYMSASKFYQNYALKSNDGEEILENYEDKVLIVALTLGNGEPKLAKDIAEKLINQEFQPATPDLPKCRKGKRWKDGILLFS